MLWGYGFGFVYQRMHELIKYAMFVVCCFGWNHLYITIHCFILARTEFTVKMVTFYSSHKKQFIKTTTKDFRFDQMKHMMQPLILALVHLSHWKWKLQLSEFCFVEYDTPVQYAHFIKDHSASTSTEEIDGESAVVCCSDDWCQYKLKRLYFVWICRDIQSFYWFADLLCGLHERVKHTHTQRCMFSYFSEDITYSSFDFLSSYWHCL